MITDLCKQWLLHRATVREKRSSRNDDDEGQQPRLARVIVGAEGGAYRRGGRWSGRLARPVDWRGPGILLGRRGRYLAE